MKNLTVIFMLSCCTLLTSEVYSMEWKKASLIINEIDHKRGGDICVYIFMEEGFPKKHDKALKKYCYSATNTSIQFDIHAPDKPFAIKVLHDEDSSGTVTKDWTGFIPAEGLGFSSGAELGFGPPSFDDAVMSLPHNGKIKISIIYP